MGAYSRENMKGLAALPPDLAQEELDNTNIQRCLECCVVQRCKGKKLCSSNEEIRVGETDKDAVLMVRRLPSL